MESACAVASSCAGTVPGSGMLIQGGGGGLPRLIVAVCLMCGDDYDADALIGCLLNDAANQRATTEKATVGGEQGGNIYWHILTLVE